VFPAIVLWFGQDAMVGLELRLLTRSEAERVIARRRDPVADPPWAAGYPLDGDSRACAAYVTHLPSSGGSDAVDVFGYYQVLEDGLVVGGIGFHGPPSGNVVEVGYGVVPAVRERGVATQALRILLDVAAGLEGVRRVVGRTEETNVASQRVMSGVGMQLVGRDPDFLHFEIDLQTGSGPSGRGMRADPGDRQR
jgi:RimJ/RimL family protein N-acetyltransferase